jgi:hypothetical protein
MTALHPVCAFVALLGIASCSGTEQGTHAQEAAGAALKVGSLSADRAASSYCWVHCGSGFLCNEESGECERGECLPSCEYGSHCILDVRGERYCVSDSDRKGTRGSLRISTSSASSASPPADAGVPAR